MSFYNLVHGINPLAPIVLRMLKLTQKDVPRVRDAWWNGEHLCVYTRTGGPNRAQWDAPNDENQEGPWNSTLRAHPNYVRDEDDGYDDTYATFYFTVPDGFEPAWTAAAAAHIERRTADERWRISLENIKKGGKDDPVMQRMVETFQPLFDAMARGESGTFEV